MALTFVAALALYALVMPISAFAATPTTIEVSNSSEFDNAVATINAATSGEYIIELTDDIQTGGASFSSSQPVSIVGNRHTITLKQYGSISIEKGAELDLGSKNGGDSLTISGGNVNSNDVPGLLYVQGSCNMYSGVTVSDREGNNYFGGGVTVQGGTFHMLGGTIKNCGINGGSMCYGGGVAVIYGGAFTMDGGEITDCYVTANWEADWDSRMISALGGGVFVSGGSSFVMNGGTISGNKSTDMGGGVASYGNFTSLTIDGCTITGNKASNYGGGFAAESNSSEGAGTTITNTKLCNNIADKAASDVYLNGSVAKLSAAKDMDELYLGKPDDVTNKKIDSWYLDNEDARYTTQAKEQRNEYADYASIGSDGKVCLVAAAKPSLVKITFANEDGNTIYSEDWYEIGTKADQITVPTPTKPSDDKYDYVFDSWHTAIEDVTGDVVYKAQFKKVFKNFSAKYTFNSASSDKQLPSEVLAVLPKDTNNYVYNDAVNAIKPSQTTVDVANGTWIFMGYDRDSAIADMTTADSEGNVTFTGSWKFVEKSDTPSAPDNSDQSGANGSDKSQVNSNDKSGTAQEADSPSPNTADGTSVGFCYTLLIAAIVALGSAVYANSRIRRRRNRPLP